MKNKFIVILVSTIFSFTASASTSGLYLGIGAGLQNLLSQNELTDLDEDNGNILTIQSDSGQSGISGNIYAGYKKNINDKLFLAVQIDGGISSAKATTQILEYEASDSSTDTSSFQTKLKNSYGVSLRPGIALNASSNGFLLFGLQRADFEYRLNTLEANNSSNFLTNTKHISGFKYGLGTEVNLSKGIAVRLELSQTKFANKNIFSFPVDGKFASKNKINEGSLSLVYYPQIA